MVWGERWSWLPSESPVGLRQSGSNQQRLRSALACCLRAIWRMGHRTAEQAETPSDLTSNVRWVIEREGA